MPMFADAYISSLGYLRPNVLFENNGERSERATDERGRRERKIPRHYPLALAVNKSPAVYILSPRRIDFEEKIEGLWTGYASIRKYAFPS